MIEWRSQGLFALNAMYSRWFNIAVVVLWLATMSWLVQDKVLPLLSIGEPPRLPELVDPQLARPPVGWDIFVDQKRLGWALTETVLQDSGMRSIRGRVHLDGVPLADVVPGMLQPIAKLIGCSVGDLKLDACNVLNVDALGNLLYFESSLRVDRPKTLIVMNGIVDKGQLKIRIRAAGWSVTKDYPYPANALPSDFFSPQASLPGLYKGRAWTVPVYSPLIPSRDPLKIIHASVEDLMPINWNGEMEDVWLVVQRNETGRDDGDQNLVGKLWVRRDGTVVRQQAKLPTSTVTLVRMEDGSAEELVKSAGEKWWMPESRMWAGSHD